MKPACSWCKDYTKYYENVQLRILIQNYKKLCGLIKITRLWSNLVKQGDQGSDIMDIVRESEGEKLKNLKRGSIKEHRIRTMTMLIAICLWKPERATIYSCPMTIAPMII